MITLQPRRDIHSVKLLDELFTLLKHNRKIDFRPMRMNESKCELFFPFAGEAGAPLVDQYINYFGELRLGKLMEDMDAMAGAIAYKHCQHVCSIDNPLTIVTASVDKIHLLKTLSPSQNLRMTGNVFHVGKSSMQVLIKMTEVSAGGVDGDNLVEAIFTMVARDKDQKATAVPSLVLESKEEERLFQIGESERKKRLSDMANSTEKIPPTAEESKVIHDIFIHTRNKIELPSNEIWISDTLLSSTRICNPQERNIHNFIFGGYLIREAYELSFATAMIYSQCRPLFIRLDEISFKKPVPIGSLLIFTSKVVYSKDKIFRVTVSADIMDAEKGTRETTNTFHFEFQAIKKGELRTVLPQSYSEAMYYVEGKRRFERVNKS